jgi:hypothetical protein
MVPFIPVPAPRGCRRLDTSIQTGPEAISGTDLQHGAVHSYASAKPVSKTRHFNHTGPEVISYTNLQHGAVHSCASAKRVSKTRHFSPNSTRGQFQALSFSTVPFIPAPVPSGYRRLDTSVTLGRRQSQALTLRTVPFIPAPGQAGVEDSTLQSKLDPQVISGTHFQHGAVPSCTSAKRVSKTRHFNHIGPEAISGTDIEYGAVHSCASAKRVSKTRHFNPNWIRR